MKYEKSKFKQKEKTKANYQKPSDNFLLSVW